MFLELIASIKNEIIKVLFTVQLQAKEDEALNKLKEEMNESQENISTNFDQDVQISKKIARNEPCPCGSGKKYKQCHGKLT